MFPGRRKKEAKVRMEKMRVSLENSPEAMASLKLALMGQMMSTLGIHVFEWVSEKKGRRFVMESGDEGVALSFEEEGKEVVPGFMNK